MHAIFLLLTACTNPEADSGDPIDIAWSCPDAPTAQVDLPADDAQHTEPVEWWYWTGHLQDEEARWYGFEQAAFVFQMTGYQASMVHSAVTDVDAGTFTYDVAYEHGLVPEVQSNGFAIAVETASVRGGDGHDSLHGETEDLTFDLVLDAEVEPVLQHGDGYHDYDVGGYTWYYSRPRMTTTGSLTVGGETRAVTGTSWFDHQWGDLLATSTAGWDWFALQLDDGRDLMLFLVTGSDALVGGSIRDGDCVTEIDPTMLSVSGTDEWVSPETGCSYPQEWELEVEGIHLHISSLLPDQELVNSVNTYWEGASTVSGDATGRAYVELAGRCD